MEQERWEMFLAVANNSKANALRGFISMQHLLKLQQQNVEQDQELISLSHKILFSILKIRLTEQINKFINIYSVEFISPLFLENPRFLEKTKENGGRS
jgi:hypothetical protein